MGILRKKLIIIYTIHQLWPQIRELFIFVRKYHNQFSQINEVLIFLCLNDIVSKAGLLKKRLNINSKNDNFLNRIRNKNFFIKINFFLREKSTVFNLVKALGTQNVKRHFNYINPYYNNNIILSQYEDSLKKIINYSKLNKINVRFVLLPYKHQINKKCKNEYMTPQIQINKIFQKSNYTLFDFSRDFFC